MSILSNVSKIIVVFISKEFIFFKIKYLKASNTYSSFDVNLIKKTKKYQFT